MKPSPKIVYWVRARRRPVTLSEIAQGCGASLGEAISKVEHLVEAGELIDQGGDRITAAPRKWDRQPKEAPPAQKRIWKVAAYLDLKGPWPAAKVARLAEANLNYTRDYLRWLADQEHLRVYPRKGQAYLYRLHPDAPSAEKAPAWVNRRNRKLRVRKKN